MITSKATAIVFLSIAASSAAAIAQDKAGDFSLPKVCEQATGHMAGMMGKMGDMGSMMKSMDGHMSDATKGYMQAIVDMHPPMVQGAMAEDPDVAFNCSMIAHHKGAIAMAKVQLQYGKDKQAKKMAQKTIDEQSKEVDQMTKWVEEHGKK
jgi:uncharacterized protein (DUF305 family)